MEQLLHNGIVIPEPPQLMGITLEIGGEPLTLTPRQEEMAMAWARKKDTPYVQDEMFCANFALDFGAELGVEDLVLSDVDFGPCERLVDEERAAKEALTREQRKALAAQRRVAREALKAKYGYAIVDGQRVELGAYIAEPSGIFMGRGEHPLRGRWKEGAAREDVTLNLSPDAHAIGEGWGEIVWQPDSLWVARWEDKLSGKLKYVWLSDTAPVKQAREADKFDKALSLQHHIDAVRERIAEALVEESPRRRMIATACYLIDALCLRVGDEKEADEADTVGATTLRPEHVSLLDDGVVEFRFLGKDSVEWHKTLEPPQVVLDSLAELIREARPSRASADGESHPTRDLPQLFPDVSSSTVNSFLGSVAPGLTAKMFRTYHASMVVKESLENSGVVADDPEFKKWEAASRANLAAAVLCNHTKQARGSWANARERYRTRKRKAQERIERYRVQVKEYRAKRDALRTESVEKVEACKTVERRQATRARYRKRIEAAQRRIDAATGRRVRAEEALGKIRAQEYMAKEKRTWNLGTSLKSYIDPRIYYAWGRRVDYDPLAKYYTAALRRKYAWVTILGDEERSALERATGLVMRTCMIRDADDVVALFDDVRAVGSEMPLPVRADEVVASHLPALEQPWRECAIALDDRERVVGFLAVGPQWLCDEEVCLDLFAVLHPDHVSRAAFELLADECRQRVQVFEVQHPRLKYTLWPQDERWLLYADQFMALVGVGPDSIEADDD